MLWPKRSESISARRNAAMTSSSLAVLTNRMAIREPGNEPREGSSTSRGPSSREGPLVPLHPMELVLPPPGGVLSAIAATATDGLPDPLLDLLDESAPIGKAVRVAPDADSAALLIGWRSVRPEIQPEEHAVGNVADPWSRGRHVEVEQCGRSAVHEHRVHRGDVVVAHDLIRPCQVGTGGRIVVSTQELSCIDQLVVCQAGVDVVRNGSLDVGEALSSMVVDSQEAWRVGEANGLKVA